MPTRDAIGTTAAVNRHRESSCRLIHCAKARSVGDPDAGNRLVQSDNLGAPKALPPGGDR